MRINKIVTIVLVLGSAAAVLRCDGGGLPASLGNADKNAGNGPVVKFDLFALPLPEVPLPIDVATRPDPNSPTGRRVNASMVAPTEMESNTRRKIDGLDGWGVYSTISVGFTHPTDPAKAVLDVQNILDRHSGDDFAFADDAVYLINMDKTSPRYGLPVPIDLGEGNFPWVLQTPDRYYENDPRGATSNILVETVEEDTNGNGKLDPGEDTDFDGVLDHPNVVNPNRLADLGADPDRTYQKNPDGSWVIDAQGRQVPDLLTFYERETNTLMLRPVRPLEELTKYAVVLTRRLVNADGEPVRSPFPYFHHVDQTAELADLDDVLRDHPEAYGDLGGTDGVAFAWTFTTQSVRKDILTMIEGLEEGTGPFARLQDAFPREAFIFPLHQCNPYGGCAPGRELPANIYTIKAEYLAPTLLDVATQVFDLNPEEAAPLINTYQFVDYFIFGWVSSPQFLDSDADGWEEESWDVNWKTGRGLYTPGRVNFVAMVPKAEYIRAYNEANGKPENSPSPVVFYGHGYTGFKVEGLGFAGSLAKFGLTTVTWDCVHHGVGIDAILKDVAMGIFNNEDLHGAGLALLDDRAIDMDNDKYDGPGSDPADLLPPPCGKYPCFPTMHFDVPFSGYAQDVAELPGGEDTDVSPNTWLGNWDGQRWSNVLYQDDVEDSAGDFWTSYVFHTRDLVRQSALDLIRIIHYFGGFDGTTPAQFDIDGDGEEEPYDFNKDGRNDLSGDFDGDGDIDFGGPDNEYYVWGQSLGGIMAGVLGGTHPSIRAVAPVSGGGGLGDVGIRSTQGGVKEAVILRMMGPLVVTVPAATRYSTTERDNRTACCASADEACPPEVLSLRFVIPQLNSTGEVEIACLNANSADPDNRTLLPGDVVVLRNMRRPTEPRCFVAGAESRVRLSIPSDMKDPLEITIYDGSSATGGAYPLVDANTCQVAPGVKARTVGSPASPTYECAADRTCPIEKFEVDPPPFEWDDWNLGDQLVSPAEGLGLRRGTPSIRRFMGLAQLVLDPGDPAVYAPYYRNSMNIVTVGDMNVPTNTGISISRCAGSLPFYADSRRDDLGGRTPNRQLLDYGVIMGLERLNRPEWGTPLVDVDDFSRGADGYGQLRPETMTPPQLPMRSWVPSGDAGAARCDADLPSGDTLGACTPPAGAASWCCCYRDAAGALESVNCLGGTSALMLPYISAVGEHGFYVPDPNLAFDINTYMINAIGRFFQTQGRIIDWRTCLESNTCEYIPEFPFGPDWP
jgi:hypothetical protein